MHLSEALQALKPSHPAAEQAARFLSETLTRMARELLPQEFRDDAAAAVLLRLWSRPLQDELLAQGDIVCGRYLRAMLRNWWLSSLRRRRKDEMREDERELEALIHRHHAAGFSEESHEEEEVPNAQELLQKLFDRAISKRQARYHGFFIDAWKQMNELFRGEKTVRQLLVEAGELSANANAKETLTAENRVFKAHQRVREALAEAAAEMARDGTLNPADQDQLQELLLRFAPRSSRKAPA